LSLLFSSIITEINRKKILHYGRTGIVVKTHPLSLLY